MTLDEKIQASKFWKISLAIQRWILFISNMAVIITLMAVVLSRQIFHYNILGYSEVLIIAAFWMYFIGSSYAAWEDSHIKADVLNQFVSDRNKLILKTVSKIIEIIVSVPFIYFAGEMLVFDIETRQSTIDLGVPLAVIQSAIFICFVLMTFYSLVYVMRNIHMLKNLKDK